MQGFKNILFPTDFSECSVGVFPRALEWVKKFNARLHLLFVARDLSYLASIRVDPDLLTHVNTEIAHVGESQMKAFCEEYLRDFTDFDTKVVIGNPQEEILRYVKERSIDLIIMSTHGRKDLNRTLIGSVADHVVKYAAVPVVTINPFRSDISAYLK